MVARFPVVCWEQDNGSFFAVCPEVKGIFTQGDTRDEAIANIRDLLSATIVEEGINTDRDKEYFFSEVMIPITA